MRQACLCLDPPRLEDLPRHGASAALKRVLFLNVAVARNLRVARDIGESTLTQLLVDRRVVPLMRALKRAKRVYLRRIKTLGVAS